MADRAPRREPHRDAHRARLNASPAAIVDALTDFEHYTEWQTGVLECTVKERDEQGRGTLVEICFDARITKVRYTSRYWYELDAGRMGFDLVDGDLTRCTGRYTFESQDDGSTTVGIEITADVGFFVPGPLKKLIRNQSVKMSMRDLANRVGG